MISQDGAQLVEELERRYLERSTDLNTLLTVQRRVLQARRDGLDLALQEMLVRQWLGAAMGTLGQ